MLEDTVGYHVFVNMKALNTEIQCYLYYTVSLFGKFRARKNIGREEMGQSVMVFMYFEGEMTHIKNWEC